MSEHRYQQPSDTGPPELDWRDFQPSWLSSLLISFGLAGVCGGLAYYQTGDLMMFAVGIMGGLMMLIYLRYIHPRYEHLWWGDQ